MNISLAIIGGLVGLFVTGVAVYTAWITHQLWKGQSGEQAPHNRTGIAASYLSRWTMFDYAVVGVSLIGFLLLLAELMAVLRDQTVLEGFHFAYLLSGVIFAAMGMIMLFVRLLIVLSLIRSGVVHRSVAVTPDHQSEPDNANRAK